MGKKRPKSLERRARNQIEETIHETEFFEKLLGKYNN